MVQGLVRGVGPSVVGVRASMCVERTNLPATNRLKQLAYYFYLLS